jgi:hypothetical protein
MTPEDGAAKSIQLSQFAPLYDRHPKDNVVPVRCTFLKPLRLSDKKTRKLYAFEMSGCADAEAEGCEVTVCVS